MLFFHQHGVDHDAGRVLRQGGDLPGALEEGGVGGEEVLGAGEGLGWGEVVLEFAPVLVLARIEDGLVGLLVGIDCAGLAELVV